MRILNSERRKAISSRKIAIFLLLAYFAMGAGLGESVLCFGADGHVAIETAAPDGTCSSISGRATPPLPGSDRSLDASSSQDHCDSCVDFPVLANDIGRSIPPPVFHKASPVPFAGGMPSVLAGSSMPGMHAALFHTAIRYDLPDPTSISFRNTVLLI